MKLIARFLIVFSTLWLMPLYVGLVGQYSSASVLPSGIFSHYGWSSLAFAAECKQERRRVPSLKPKTYEMIQEAQQLIDPDRFNKDNPDQAVVGIKSDPHAALALLKEGRDRKGMNEYEVAQFWNMMAYAYYTLGDTNNAMNAYQQVLKTEKISLALELSTLQTLFQLYLIKEDYDTALKYILRWEKVNCKPDPGMIYFKAYIELQKGNHKKALEYALEVERVALEQERKIKEDWWYLQVILYSEKKDYDNVIKVLEKLITNYQKKRYWVHLSGMYSEKGREDEALSAAYAAYIQGMFDRETEIVILTQRLLSAEVPYEAALVMDKGIKDEIVKESEKNLRLLAQAYTMSRETKKAIEAWKRATKYGKDGELYFRLAQAQTNDGLEEDAISSYREALRKGDLKDPAQVNYWLGITLINTVTIDDTKEQAFKKLDDAIEAFKKAIEQDEESKDRYNNYIKYAESEKNRIKAIDDLMKS